LVRPAFAKKIFPVPIGIFPMIDWWLAPKMDRNMQSDVFNQTKGFGDFSLQE